MSQGDDGVVEHLPTGGAYQMKYGYFEMAPLNWIDDIINGAEQLEHARQISTNINYVMRIMPESGEVSLHYNGF